VNPSALSLLSPQLIEGICDKAGDLSGRPFNQPSKCRKPPRRMDSPGGDAAPCGTVKRGSAGLVVPVVVPWWGSGDLSAAEGRCHRFTETWVKRDGRWQVVAGHYSNVPPALAPPQAVGPPHSTRVGDHGAAPLGPPPVVCAAIRQHAGADLGGAGELPARPVGHDDRAEAGAAGVRPAAGRMTQSTVPVEPSKSEVLGRYLARRLIQLAREGYSVEQLVRLLREPAPRRVE
jgi:hypothetical protein